MAIWFKNLRVYRLTETLALDPEALHQTLAEKPFAPCGSHDAASLGWSTPLGRHSEQLVHACNGYLLLCAKKQEKVIPAAAVNEQVEERAQALAEKEQRKVGRKERQSIKDEVIFEMRPKALTRSSLTYAYISLKDGMVVVNSTTAAAAEELLTLLRDTLGSFPVVPLSTKSLPQQSMTHWLTSAESPEHFTFGCDCDLRDPSGGGVIRCKNQDLCAEEIHNHLASGMQVHKLALTWKDGISFALDDQLALKGVKFADELLDKASESDSENYAAQFDAEFSVMTLEVSSLLTDLLQALGGVNDAAPDVDAMVVQATRDEADANGVEEVTIAHD